MKESKEVYERISEQFEDFTARASQRKVEVDTFRSMVGNIEGLRILDLACGHGFFSRQLKDWGAAKVHGVDISENMIYQARQANDGIAYEVRDVAKMGRIGAYDMVTAAWLFNYASSVDELSKMFQSAADNLKPGGQLVAYTANPSFELRKGNFTRYGIEVFDETPVAGGFRCNAQFMSSPPAPFTYYRWEQGVYEEAARVAGFNQLTWVAPLISEHSRTSMGAGYWQLFERNSLQIGLTCRK